MKTRHGFVSNSSSSSFIVGVKNGETKITIPIEVDLSKYHSKIIKTKDELDDYFIDYYGYKTLKELLENDNCVLELYNKSLDILNKGETVIAGDFASDGDPLEAFLCENGFTESENITIIKNADGY